MKSTSENKRIIGHEQEYPGSCRWPIYEYKCPECNDWTAEIHGQIDGQDKAGEYTPCCKPCGEIIDAELFAK